MPWGTIKTSKVSVFVLKCCHPVRSSEKRLYNACTPPIGWCVLRAFQSEDTLTVSEIALRCLDFFCLNYQFLSSLHLE